MVNRPPPSAGGAGRNDDAEDMMITSTSARTSSSSSTRGPRRGLEWSLRSLHKFDTSAQHFLSNYYGQEEDSDLDIDDICEELLEDQTAFEIFKAAPQTAADEKATAPGGRPRSNVWAALHDPLRTGVVDGKKVVFELKTNVNQKPATQRKERLERRHVIVNAHRSPLEVRIRFWLMHFSLPKLSAAFLAFFVMMNVAFAGLFYATEEHCCGDPSMTFGENFAFSIQTSTTIGYGSFSPSGSISNFLVVVLSYMSTLMNTLFAGLLFTRFVTPVINIQFSEVMTLCNVNGVPCLSFRLGNSDGHANPLTDINVRLTYSYEIPYTDHKGAQKFFRQTEELKLLSNRQHGLMEVWTLRHVLDESSPLFGLHFEEHPANKIYVFTLSVDAVQDLTKSQVNVQTEYALEDILIGHNFRSVLSVDDEDVKVVTSDFSKMSDTEPYPVWYPAKAGVHSTREKVPTKVFKP